MNTVESPNCRPCHSLVATLPVPAFVCDAEGKIKEVNQRLRAWTSTSGLANPDPGHVEHLITKFCWPTFREALQKESKGELRYGWECRSADFDDPRHSWKIVSAGDHFMGWMESGYPDSGTRYLTDAQVNHEHVVAVLEKISEGFITFDRDYTILFLNDKAAQFLQRQRPSLLGQSLWKEFPDAVDSVFHQNYEKAFRECRSVYFEGYYTGLGIWLEVHAHPTGENLAVYFSDVTERKAQELRAKERAALLEAAREAMMTVTPEGSITYANPKACSLFGLTDNPGEPSLMELFPVAAHSRLRKAMQMVRKTGSWEGELALGDRRKSSSPVLDASWSWIEGTGDAPSRIFCIFSDISGRKKLEAQFLRVQRLESIGTLAGGIAHDLNNILGPILLGVGLMQNKIDDPDLQGTLQLLDSSARRGAEMVKQVLAFASGLEGRFAEVRIDQIVSEVARIVQLTFPKNIEVELKVDSQLAPIQGDATQIHQVLLNLAVNARDAMPGGGSLRIQAKVAEVEESFRLSDDHLQAGFYICISVEDTGSGIPAAILNRIFDPFFTTKPRGKGTGLGLPTAMLIMKAHGGGLHVYTEEGRGTVFKAYFPCRAPADEIDQDGMARTTPRLGKGEYILVVDDEYSILEMARKTLESHGYRVFTASNGEEALALFTAHQTSIKVVFLDMMMPVMDGRTTLQSLRKIDPVIPIVGTSGLHLSSKSDQNTLAKLDAFLAKPYTHFELLSLIANLAEKNTTAQGVGKIE